MVSDSIINASIPNNNNSNVAKDMGKKKRANRSAKLKQCKLDARREQWLSQVKNKGTKEETNADSGGGEFNAPNLEVRSNRNNHQLKDLETRRRGSDGSIHHDSDSESPAASPTSCLSAGNDVSSSSNSSSSSSSTSGYSVGCCSGSITEEDEDDCLDDWEAVADALAADDTKDTQNQNKVLLPEIQTVAKTDDLTGVRERGYTVPDHSKSENVGIEARSVANAKAWRPDDAFRPQSLPNLSKQSSLPMNLGKNCDHGVYPWNRDHVISVPSSCPICYEDLDLTDSSFQPCSCGFRLCLFCHKRISEEDGRCPGCRKPFDLEPVEKETSVSGGSLTIRLNRSCSMFSRG